MQISRRRSPQWKWSPKSPSSAPSIIRGLLPFPLIKVLMLSQKTKSEPSTTIPPLDCSFDLLFKGGEGWGEGGKRVAGDNPTNPITKP